jgi:sterol desaturase/sphingolipid hydroxylase (fatty acid hydroxylase superfamily)
MLHHPSIYSYVHKIHHKYNNIIPIITFYQHPIDILLTNSIPMFLSLYILPHNISLFQLKLLFLVTIYVLSYPFIVYNLYKSEKKLKNSFIN